MFKKMALLALLKDNSSMPRFDRKAAWLEFVGYAST
jgi:hypothetical protein